VEGSREADGVDLVFGGTARTFIGIVTVEGAKGATVIRNWSAPAIWPRDRFTPAKLSQALEQMRTALADNGFHEPTITQT